MTGRRLPLFLMIALCGGRFAPYVAADEAVVTVLADFEDDSVAASIGDVQNILAADCAVHLENIPVRSGRFCLGMDIGATAPKTSVACDLIFRVATRFDQADKVAAFCHIKEGEAEVAFRVRDKLGQIFETTPQKITMTNQYVRIAADLAPEKLQRIKGTQALAWPIQIQGYRVLTNRVGRQTVLLDDLEVEHTVRGEDAVRGEFTFDQPTRIYRPGATVNAAVVLENRSRNRVFQLSVETAWTRPDGTVLQTQRTNINLPASGNNYRSRQTIELPQRIDDPGLYRLVVRARAAGWPAPYTFETSIAVTPSNRQISRGRTTFFGAQSNLLRETVTDQLLEIEVAREIGVNLLAIETPWRLIEPKADHYDFKPLDHLIEKLVARDIAPLLVLTEPPVWLQGNTALTARVAQLVEALARNYGEKIQFYQLTAAVLDAADAANPQTWLKPLQQRISAVNQDLHILAPPLSVFPATSPQFPTPAATEAYQWTFQTTGDSWAALVALKEFARKQNRAWDRNDRWIHIAAPLLGPGYTEDAEAVLRHYVRAAIERVGGVIWVDWRDDDNDPETPDLLRGLIRRDFSPKTSLLGYASAAGMLTGLRYSGPVLNTPPEFDSALFIGNDRQVAVFFPKPNTSSRPAVLAPIQGVPGALRALDFRRQPVALLESAGPPLLPVMTHPFFITLGLKSAQPEPQLGLLKPWLRAPAQVLCGAETAFTVELDAPLALQKSYFQIILPANSPLTSSIATKALKANKGQTLQQEIRLTPKPNQLFEKTDLTLRLSLEGRNLDVPVEIRALTGVVPLRPGANLTDAAYRIGELTPAEERRATAKSILFAAYEEKLLHLAIQLEDDRFTAFQATPDGTGKGDELRLGLAAENVEGLTEARIRNLDTADLALEPLFGTAMEKLQGWRCESSKPQNKEPRLVRVTIPAAALGLDKFAPNQRLLLAVQYWDDDADKLPRIRLNWGQGLDGSRTTENFRWVELKTP